MTPFELSILVHYYGCADDFRDGDFSAPILRPTIQKMVQDELLAVDGDKRMYKIGLRGAVFVEAVCNLDLPVQKWVMP